MTLTRVVSGLGFAEGPRWHDRQLWFSDFGARVVRSCDLEGNVREVVHVPARPSGLGWLADGSLLVVSMGDQRLLRFCDGALREHADLSRFTAQACNDMVVTPAGHAYVGHMGFNLYERPIRFATAELLWVKPDGSSAIAADGLSFPNGVVLSRDGKTLIVAETFGQKLTAFEVAADGSLGQRRVFAALPGRAPDGICLDLEGAVWVADAAGKACVRVREGGEIVEVVDVGRGCFACALGGRHGRTLYLCTAEGYDDASMARLTGAIDSLEVSVPG